MKKHFPSAEGAQNSIRVHTVDNIQLHVSRDRYPTRPNRFFINPDVETIYNRYQAYREGREKLTSMAYMCYTILIYSARCDSDKEASYKYSISNNVLEKLRMISSTKGDRLEARKKPEDGIYKPLSPVEQEWIVKVIKKLILRVGEYEFAQDKPLPKIILSDFPVI